MTLAGLVRLTNRRMIAFDLLLGGGARRGAKAAPRLASAADLAMAGAFAWMARRGG